MKADVSKAKVMFDEVIFAMIMVECAFQALSSLGSVLQFLEFSPLEFFRDNLSFLETSLIHSFLHLLTHSSVMVTSYASGYITLFSGGRSLIFI